MGLELFNLFAARKEVPSLRILERIRIPYRDDNRFVWEFAELTWQVERVRACQSAPGAQAS
jgi:hypothetical protein